MKAIAKENLMPLCLPLLGWLVVQQGILLVA